MDKVNNILAKLQKENEDWSKAYQEEKDEQFNMLTNSIPKQKIKDKIKELSKYRDLAKELIEHKIVVADSDSLNYGRAEAHDKDIQVLKELLGMNNMIIQSTREATREELIQRINELQKENKYLRDENAIYRNETISKSIIRNKINKLKDEFDFYAGREHAEWQDGEFDGEVCDDLALQISVLKELLEGE